MMASSLRRDPVGGRAMSVSRILRVAKMAGASLIGLVVLASDGVAPLTAQIETNSIEGVVRGPRGPEAGVWVIAETRDLPTGFARIVVTDDEGRYVLPDLPTARYQVWVRGYGLVDSPKVAAGPGQVLNLNA